MGYFAGILIWIVVGIVVVVIRYLKNSESKFSVKHTLKRIEKNPQKAEEYAQKLDCFLGRYTCKTPMILGQLIEDLEACDQIGNFNIEATYRLMNGSYLIVTKHTYQAQSSHPDAMKSLPEVYHVNYLAIYKWSQKEIVIQSHQYTNREEERMLKEFPKTIFKVLEDIEEEA